MPNDSEIKWYVVHTYSGYENKVMNNLLKSVENNHLQDVITDIVIPTEDVTEIKNGKRKVVQRKLLPGYVLVKMLNNERTWYLVRNTRGVTGFVGSGNDPTPLSDEDFEAIFANRAEVRTDFRIGDTVRILGGAFENQIGKITSIEPEREKLSVQVDIGITKPIFEFGFEDVILDLTD